MKSIDPNDPRRSEVEPVETESDAFPLSIHTGAGHHEPGGDTSAWLPMVRDLMATGLSLQQAVDQLTTLAVAAHRMQQAETNQAAIAPIEHRLKYAADTEGGPA